MFIDSVLKALKFSIINLDEAPIKLDGIKLYDCFDTPENVIKKIQIHYLSSLIKQALNLIGSVEFIGNPIGFLSNIETGFTDLFEKPLEGFIKGPLEGSVGIYMGAKSLVNQTVAGTFNSLNKIIGSLGSGVSQLSLDQEYLNLREQMKNKRVTHFGSGINQAGQSIFEGVEQGIMGVVLKPLEGAQSSGFTGFLKGSLQGLLGMVVKPITGALDAGSKTSEAIKVMAMGDSGPKTTRERQIRVFYDSDQYFKIYNPEDAKCVQSLQIIKNGRFSGQQFLHQVPIDIENQIYLIITLQSVLLINIKERMRIWDINADNIISVDMRLDGICINLREPTKKQPNKYETVRIKDSKLKEWTVKQINHLIELQI